MGLLLVESDLKDAIPLPRWCKCVVPGKGLATPPHGAWERLARAGAVLRRTLNVVIYPEIANSTLFRVRSPMASPMLLPGANFQLASADCRTSTCG